MALLMAFHTYVAKCNFRDNCVDVKNSMEPKGKNKKVPHGSWGIVIFGLILVVFNVVYWSVVYSKYTYAE